VIAGVCGANGQRLKAEESSSAYVTAEAVPYKYFATVTPRPAPKD
jgi:hypothetical protein